MTSNTPVAAMIPDCGSDNVLNHTAPTPSIESDIEKALGVDDAITHQNFSPERFDNHSLSALQTEAGMTSRVADRMSWPCSSTLVKSSSVSGEGPLLRGEGTTGGPQPKEPTSILTVPWHARILGFFTAYRELSAACVPEDFASVRTRLEKEWIFDGGFLVGLAAVNVAMFAITPHSIFKLEPYSYAVATSSAACGLGIACDVWFLVRYSWVDLGTFIHRSRDVYCSHVFFSLSSRIPTFCALVSSTLFMASMVLLAYDTWHVGVLVVGVVVLLVMTLQFIAYGVHQCATSVLRVWRAVAASTRVSIVNVVNVVQGL